MWLVVWQAEIERDTLNLVTIERDEYKTTKTRREAAAKGRSLLSKLVSPSRHVVLSVSHCELLLLLLLHVALGDSCL